MWIQLIIPAATSNMSPIHSEMYTLSGLEAATIYEAVISSRNEFGWSTLSKPFNFATIGVGKLADFNNMELSKYLYDLVTL